LPLSFSFGHWHVREPIEWAILLALKGERADNLHRLQHAMCVDRWVMEAARFDIFDATTCTTFKEHVQVIEGMTQTFISAVQNFSDIQPRESINRKVMEKYLESVRAVDCSVAAASSVDWQSRSRTHSVAPYPSPNPNRGTCYWCCSCGPEHIERCVMKAPTRLQDQPAW